VPTSDGDELWLCMKRTVDGSDYYFVEYLHQVDLEAEIEDAYFVDCGESWNGGTAAAVASVTVANPCVVTLTTWPEDSGGNDLADGNYVRFTGVTDLADQIFQVYSSDATAKTLQLKDVTGTTIINGTLFESYLSGGTMAWVTETVSGMDHLAGETLLALGDGVQLDVSADESGDVALGQWCHTVHCGLAQTGTVVSLPLEFYLKTGLTVGANKQLTALTVSLYRSYGGQYGVAADKYKDIPYRRAASETETGPFLYTGQKNLPSAGGVFDGELNVMIQCTGAYPFTIRGLAPKIAVNE